MVAHRAGNEVILWAREPDVVDSINSRHRNGAFLPSVELSSAIRATSNLSESTDVDFVFLAAPAQFMRSVCESAVDFWSTGVPAIICSKGIEQESCALMSEVVSEVLPGKPIAVLSGPTFAMEVAENLPTAVTLACEDEILAKVLMEILNSRFFRIYRSRDVIGAQIGGAVKNVLAIACGIVEGRKLGNNSRAAIISRGLAEVTRLGVSKGAQAETLYGLSGLGDLTLTCNSTQSRNFSLGVALGQGELLSDIISARNAVTEGVFTAASVVALAHRLGVILPLCSAIDGVLNHSINIDVTINALLSRPLKAEII
jgi:glycerol-3-phosphate dehydrogenase (NAD(P)+)